MADGAARSYGASIAALAQPRPPARPSPRAALARPAGSGHVLRVFDHEPDLLDGIDAPIAAQLRQRGVARGALLEVGPWTPPAEQPRDALGLLVVDGLLTRCISLMGRECPELLGAGDLLRPWDPAASASVAGDAVWRVLTPVTLAVLDGRFARLVCAHPHIVAGLLARASARSRALAFHLAIGHVRHADARLLLLLWHLAERWGRVTSEGVVLPLPLTHELLAHLAGMRRPTASTALQQLARNGRVERHGRVGWLLHGAPPDADEVSAA